MSGAEESSIRFEGGEYFGNLDNGVPHGFGKLVYNINI